MSEATPEIFPDRPHDSGADSMPGVSAQADPFLSLHKMSTTAGLGSGDYVAINGAAIATLLLGIASSIVLFGGSLLLILPVGGLICGILAFRQISDSNGTQAGRGLAAMGLLLSLGIGGGYLGKLAIETVHDQRERQQVISLIEQFGNLIKDGPKDPSNYNRAYDLCDNRFKNQVSLNTFIDTWKGANRNSVSGEIAGMTWNGLLKFDTDPITGNLQANGMVKVSYQKIAGVARQGTVFQKIDDTWRIDQMSELFPIQAAPPKTAPSNPRYTTPRPSDTAGPPAPPKN